MKKKWKARQIFFFFEWRKPGFTSGVDLQNQTFLQNLGEVMTSTFSLLPQTPPLLRVNKTSTRSRQQIEVGYSARNQSHRNEGVTDSPSSPAHLVTTASFYTVCVSYACTHTHRKRVRVKNKLYLHTDFPRTCSCKRLVCDLQREETATGGDTAMAALAEEYPLIAVMLNILILNLTSSLEMPPAGS